MGFLRFLALFALGGAAALAFSPSPTLRIRIGRVGISAMDNREGEIASDTQKRIAEYRKKRGDKVN
ncbi:unnamed protein product, partial [Chrysoparadoxa australica]